MFDPLGQFTIVLHNKGAPLNIPKPSALMNFAVAIPITRPLLSNTGPPELPGLIGAVKVPTNVALSTLDTIPVVKIPAKPRGLPSTPTQ